MCQRVTCSTCGKPTFRGCGRHVEEVLGDVKPDARCKCREQTGPGSETRKERASGRIGALWQTIRGKP